MSEISNSNKVFLKVLIISLSFIWVGAVFSISFVEAPLKFQAPNITTALALGIGKIVFQALNIIEWVISALIIISLIVLQSDKKVWLLYLLPVSILMVQSIYSLPVLMERADLVIANEPLPEGYYHIVHGVFEVVKFLLIAYAGIIFTAGNVRMKD